MNKSILFSLLALLFVACSQEDNTGSGDLFGSPPKIQLVTKTQALQQGEEMFDDNETVDEIIASHRTFAVNKPVNAEMTTEGKLRLYNFMAHTFSNLEVWMVPVNRNDTILLTRFEEVPPFYDIRIDSPLKSGDALFQTKSGKPVFIKNPSLLSPSDFSLIVDVKGDRVFETLKTIKLKTSVKMGRYGEGNWAQTTPIGARYLSCGIVNMAAYFSSQEFRDSLLTYPGNLPDNNGNPVDRGLLLNQIYSKGALVLGLVANYEGLGGGNALGIRFGLLPNMFYKNRVELTSNGSIFAFTHEFGHCIGYGHGSCMAYGDIDYTIGPKVYRVLMQKGALPYLMDPFKTYNDYDPKQATNRLLCHEEN